jgi:hypothetical protein
MKNDAIITTLQHLVDGLWYITETDATFEVCDWGSELPQEILPNTAKKVAIEEFFIPFLEMRTWQTEEDQIAGLRYETLLQELQKMLTDLCVYRVGKTDIDVYVVGKTPDSNWVGLKTFAVET